MEGFAAAVVEEMAKPTHWVETLFPVAKPKKREKRARKPIARDARPRKVRKTSRGKLTREADRLFSLIIRHPGRCIRAHEHAGALQCAHKISRSYRSVRWDEDNAVPLCAGAHTYYTHHPVEWRGFLIEMFGWEALSDLETRALFVWDKDIESVLARLRARAEELGIK